MRQRWLVAVEQRLRGTDRRAWLTVFALCAPLYLLTAHYTAGSIDTQASAWPAWQLVHHGNLYIDRFHLFWSTPVGHHLVSNRTAGTILVNVPAALLLWPLGPTFAIGAVTAVALSAATAATLFLVLRRLVSFGVAVGATATLAFGTGLWSVASTELWTHTVDALCLALAGYALSRWRPGWAGVALGVAICARPQVAVVAAVLGLGLGWHRRSWRVLLAIGAPASVGLAALVCWNRWIYQHASISGGYGSYASANLVGGGSSSSHASATTLFSTPDGGWPASLAGFLFSPQRGLFVFTPVALIVIVGVRSAWRASPVWTRWFAVAGVAYSLVQLRINSFAGGDAFFGYRLAIELVVCAAPLAVVAHETWSRADAGRRRIAHVLATASVVIQAAGAALFVPPLSSPSRPWRASPLLDALRVHPRTGLLLCLAAASACVFAAGRALPAGAGYATRRAGASGWRQPFG